MEVHSRLGPGLLEGVYAESLCHELAVKELAFKREVKVPIRYRGVALATPLSMDLVVEESLIVEIKAVEALRPVHDAQLLTYMRLSGVRLGLLINFNVRHLRDGIHRRKL